MLKKMFRWNKKNLFLFLLGSIFVLSVFGLPSQVFGADWYVSKSGNDSNGGTSWDDAELTIGAAVTDSANGDTIYIGSGTYDETVNLDTANKSITLDGIDKTASIARTGTGQKGIILEDNTTIKNLAVSTTSKTTGSIGIYGAGGPPFGKNGIVIENCDVIGAADGISIANSRGLRIENCDIKGYYDALNVSGSTNLIVKNCSLYTDGTWSINVPARALVGGAGGDGIFDNCTMTSERSDASSWRNAGIELIHSREYIFNNCSIRATAGSNNTGNVYGSYVDGEGINVILNNSAIETSTLGVSGTAYDLYNLAGTITVHNTSYDKNKTFGTITDTTETELGMKTQPGGGTAGIVWLQQSEVYIQDADGNIDTADNTTQVTAVIGTDPSGGTATLSGTTTVTAASGVATFTNLKIDKAGTGYTLNFTSSPALTEVTSGTFNITASASTVTTQDVTSVATSTATGNGTITDTGGENASSRGVEWGITSGVYASSSTESGSFDTGAFTESITGLSPNTIYYYRAKAYNSADWGYGSEKSFTTLANVPSGLALTADSISQITASWSANSNPAGTYYYIENTTAGTNSDWTTSASWNSTGLTCGTTYSFQVKARNGNETETGAISLTQSTKGCGGGGLPSAAYNPPSPPAPSPENPQGGFKVLINNGVETADKRVVGLKLFTGSNTVRMAISNNPDFSGPGTGQITYQSSYNCDLCYWQKECLDGSYIVYAKFYTQWGQSSQVVSDSIILDTVPKKEEVIPPKPKPEVPEIPIEKPTEPIYVPEAPTLPALPTVIPTPQALAESKPDTPIFFSTQGNIILESIVPQKPLKLDTGLQLKIFVKPSKPVKAIKVIIIFKGPKESSYLKDNFLSSFVSPVYARVWQVAKYTLTDENGDGIFEGEIKLPEVAGEYVIKTTLYYEDGTIEDIETETLIDPKGYIYQATNGKEIRIPDAKISLYHFNSETNQFELWQAKDYDQENPRVTDKTGEYNFLVPEGKYYLTITAPDYKDYQSEEFEVKEGDIINRNIELTPIKKFNWNRLLFPVIFIIVGIIIGIFVKLKRKHK